MCFLVCTRPDLSAEHIYVDICILTLKIRIALCEALNAALPINRSYLDPVWYHVKLLRSFLNMLSCLGSGPSD